MDEKEIFYKLLMTGASVRLRKIYDLRKEKYFEEVHAVSYTHLTLPTTPYV